MKILFATLAISMAAAAQPVQESDQLGEIADRLAGLQQQVADAQAMRQDEMDRRAAQHEQTVEALGTLRQAEASLETGSSDGVDDQLAQAETALDGRTRLDVEAARDALSREDLLPARQYLAAALAERRIPR